jgi:N-acetylglucosaminyl-diphospho-decaprenol L-rhamnosyltransferase
MEVDMDVSIIIVNWNSVAFLRQCLESIYRNTVGTDFEVIVFDNASFDGSKEMLQQEYPAVRFIQSDRNLGFAKANNAAFNVSRGRNILFLNPDTEIEGSALETLNQWLNSLPNVGIVGAKLLNSDRSVQKSCVQAFPTILNQLLDADALRSMFPRARIWGMAPLFTEDRTPTEVEAVSGAALMIKRSVFESVGMFSTDYFMYSEDIDLCFKMHKAGQKTYYVPTAVIVHHGGTSSLQSNVNAFSDVMMLESRWRFFRKTRPQWYCWLYRMAMLFAGMIRIGLVMLFWPIYVLRGRGASIRNILKKWTASLRWIFGGEGWINNY